MDSLWISFDLKQEHSSTLLQFCVKSEQLIGLTDPRRYGVVCVCLWQMLSASELASLLGLSATLSTPSRHQTRIDDHMLGLIASPSRHSGGSSQKPLVRSVEIRTFPVVMVHLSAHVTDCR